MKGVNPYKNITEWSLKTWHMNSVFQFTEAFAFQAL